MADTFAIAIVGAGMAGASLAAALTPHARVLVIEAEDRPGYHATGRSAAFWTESYGGPAVQPLTGASGVFLRAGGFLSPRGALTIGGAGDEMALARFAEQYAALGVRVEHRDRAAMAAMVPGLRPQWTAAIYEPDCCDIDVAGLHQHYLRGAAAASLWTRARLVSATRSDRWHLTMADGRNAEADVLVNAAGAWADEVAALAGARPLGITPLRRTMAQLRVDPPALTTMPLVLDINERFYFKPESGRIWLTPHDETPSAPCDAAAEELDVATAIDRFSHVVDCRIERIEHRWAGLRSFSPDRVPVYGFDPRVPGLFWFAGQGGFGIQTAPAAATLAARLLKGESGGEIDPAPYNPFRFG